jgi:hypothetical protein
VVVYLLDLFCRKISDNRDLKNRNFVIVVCANLVEREKYIDSSIDS